MNRRRAVVLVTEGVAPELLDRWGPDVLPAFGRLRAEGAWGTMRSELVPYEPPGLISAFTGHGPAEHGVFSYWDAHSPDYEPAVLDSSAPRRPLLWQRPELADLTTAVVNVFGTHPVEPLNGSCIAYPMRRTLHACHPRDLPVRLGRAGIHPAHDVNIWFTGQDRAEFTRKVLGADRARADAALHLFDGGQGEPPELLVLNLTAIDRLSHVYWQELEPGSPVAADDQAVRQAYRQVDEVLGEFLDRADATTEVLAFSEIGFGPLRAYVSVNDVLEAAGLLTKGADGRPDWAATEAFEAVQGTQGVNLNTAGRYKHGTVQPHRRAETERRVCAALLAHRNPYTGLPLFADVLRAEDVHSGPAADRAPDLILVPHDWRYLPLGDTHWSAQVHRTLQSGWHRRESYWGGIGRSFGTGTGATGQPLDVAPTVLRMLGRAPLADLTGSPLGVGG